MSVYPPPRLLAYLLAAVALATALYLAAELAYLGFPDGHLTAQERATAGLLPWYAAGSLLASGYFAYLGTRPGTSGRRVAWAAVGYLLLAGVGAEIAAACTAGLEGGGGG